MRSTALMDTDGYTLLHGLIHSTKRTEMDPQYPQRLNFNRVQIINYHSPIDRPPLTVQLYTQGSSIRNTHPGK